MSQSSMAQTSGSNKPKRNENVEIKPVEQEIEFIGVLKSDFNQINPSRSAEKDTKKFRFNPHFVPTEPKTEPIMNNRQILSFFPPTKRRFEGRPPISKAAKRRKKQQKAQKMISERQELMKIELQPIGLDNQQINRISSFLLSMEKGIEDFVVFEFPDACTYTTLKHSAYLNGVELTTNRTSGSYLLSLGTICIGGTTDCSEAGEDEARQAAMKYLRANCLAVQVKRRMISAWGVKTSEIESSFFMDWDYENEPQIFALSKPVRSEFEKYINMFANTYYVEKLCFSPNFSEDEKQEITSIAKSLGLQVTSEDHDVGPLVVVMGKIHPRSLVQLLLVNGEATDEYVLMPL